MMVPKPMKEKREAKIRYQREMWEMVRTVAMAKPTMMPLMPRPRTKSTRGLLPLQMDERTKSGWGLAAEGGVGDLEGGVEG